MLDRRSETTLPATRNGVTDVAIVYVVNQYPAVTHTFIKREIQALESLGFPVIRVAMRAGAHLVDPDDLAEHAKTTHILQRPWHLAITVAMAALRRPARFLKATAMAIKLMRRSDRPAWTHLVYLAEACGVAAVLARTGALHMHAHFGSNPAEIVLLASIMSGVPYSFTVHGYDEYDKPEFMGLKEKIAGATFVASVSHYGKAQLLRWCTSEDRKKIQLVHCGIDAGFKADATPVEDGTRRFVCVARFCREKAQDVLLRAVAMVHKQGLKFELVLVGDGETRPEIEALIAELNLSDTVRLTGWLSSAGVRAEILQSRALVVPSFAENLPVVIMEAMALQRPVIATYIAGIPELVRPGENGWLVPASDVAALAAAMTACLNTPDPAIREMGINGHARVADRHDALREATKLAALFNLPGRQALAEHHSLVEHRDAVSQA
jgi:colanic acid/amylovoran biosynthesis glycosyltransferase